MVIKNGKIATRMDVENAIKTHKPFPPATIPVVVTAKDYPPAHERRTQLGNKIATKKHRAYVWDKGSGEFLVGARSTYGLVEMIQSGEKFPKKEKKGFGI